MYKRIALIVCFIGSSVLTNGQNSSHNVISSSANTAVNGNIMLDWTIGEPVIATHQTPNNLFSQGFHQPTYQIVSVNKPKGEIAIRVYPNPSTDVVFIECSGTFGWTLLDIAGRILDKNTSQFVQMGLYPSGIYVLKIQQAQKEAIFQIVKP